MLEVQNIKKQFSAEHVLQDVSFHLGKNETLSILGKSGCGKTTLLKIVAGLLNHDSGTVFLDGKNLENISANARDIVYMYQEPMLFPHLNVFENIAFGLRLRKMEKNHVQQKVSEMIQALELAGQEKKLPGQLSGGQRQRVAFGRGIIINPKVILLDEPFSNLDAETREAMQKLCKQLTDSFHISALFVTHDLKEALQMGDRFAYMKNGDLKLYPTKSDFINDSSTGVQSEMQFWNSIKKNA